MFTFSVFTVPTNRIFGDDLGTSMPQGFPPMTAMVLVLASLCATCLIPLLASPVMNANNFKAQYVCKSYHERICVLHED